MKKAIFAAAVILSAVSATASATMLNINKTAVVYDCLETVTKINITGKMVGTERYSDVNILDFGDSFFAVSPSANAVAFSETLKPDGDGYESSQPQAGITMSRGIGKNAGSYLYLGTHSMISWDCRK